MLLRYEVSLCGVVVSFISCCCTCVGCFCNFCFVFLQVRTFELGGDVKIVVNSKVG